MNIGKIIFGIAISLFVIFISIYGIKNFYKSPEYNDFCFNHENISNVEESLEICPAVCVEIYEINQDKNECVFDECGSGCGPNGINSFETLKQCEIILSGRNCLDLYKEEKKAYLRNVFLITLPFGIIIIVIGSALFNLEFVGAGLIIGGIGVIFWSIGSFWKFAENWFKFLLLWLFIVFFVYYLNRKHWKRELWKMKKKMG